MQSNDDKNIDRLRQQFWKSYFLIILPCLVVGLIVGICKQSVLAGFLSYFLLLFIGTAPVVYKVYQLMAHRSEHS